MNVLVISGDKYSEREVSLRSGRMISDCAKSLGHKVSEFDPKNGYEGLDEFLGEVDVVLPILHGEGGEDGQIQSELEKRGMIYLGSNAETSKLCINKQKFKDEVTKLGFKVPQGEVVARKDILQSVLIKKPFVLKPLDEGSSVGLVIERAANPNLNVALKQFDNFNTMLLEELIGGIEITVAVLGDEALPPEEISPPTGQEYDYKNKYNGNTTMHCPPKNISKEQCEEAQKIALVIHQNLGVRHLSRTDMIVDEKGQVYILEINTMPGMTEQSHFPNEALAAGYSKEELVTKLIDLAVQDN